MSVDLTQCLAKDLPSLQKLAAKIAQRVKQKQPVERLQAQLQEQWQRSTKAWHRRQQAMPNISYPDLPVSGQRDKLVKLIQDNQVVVLAGETGSGKTTQLPKLCLQAGQGVRGLIGHTQPRRLAARTVAQRIAEELQVPLGQQVGYQVRFNEQVSDNTLVKLMTDGILLAETRQDPDLLRYDTIIVDEAHERSLNIDFLLGYLKQLLQRRKDLKLIITSATIDVERFAKHFNDAPVVQVSGRTYPVDLWYRPLFQGNDPDGKQEDRSLGRDQAVLDGVEQALVEIEKHERGKGQSVGDVLIFLSGERDIRELAQFLRKLDRPQWQIMPLYGRLSFAEQQKVFQPGGAGRRIVLATNVAETSVTVPGIRYVIDPGTARMSRYSYRSKVQRLPIEAISQASANQRKGRCGRVSAGICIRLYDEEDFLSRPEFTDAEILRTNLASVILQMQDLKLGVVTDFPFIDMPDSRFVNDGVKLLQELGALDDRRRLTPLGKQLARLPVDPRIARMVLAGAQWGALQEVLVIAAALTIQDPRERPQERQQAADQKHQQWREDNSDFLSLVNLWQDHEEQRQELSQNQLRKWCSKNFLAYMRMREWREVHRQILLMCQNMGLTINQEPASFEAIHRALLTGLLGNIGHKDEDGSFLGPRQRRFHVFPGSALYKKPPTWLMASELVETSRLFARGVAKIDPAWVEDIGGSLLKYNYSEPAWHKRQGQVMAMEQVSLYGLVLASQRKVPYGKIDADVSQQLLIMEGLVQGNLVTKGEFLAHNRDLVDEVEGLEAKTRRRDILVDDRVVFEFYEAKLASASNLVTSTAAFERWRKWAEKKAPKLLHMSKQDLMRDEADAVSVEAFPDRLHWLDMSWPLNYQFEPGNEQDGVTLRVPVSQLKRVPIKRLTWLVPGLLLDKISALIRGLPKSQRKAFVPVPNYAQAVYEALTADNIDILDAMARQLQRMSGRPFDVQLLQDIVLDDLYYMGIQVVADDGKPLAYSRDLESLLVQYANSAGESRPQAQHKLMQAGLTSFPEQALPEQITITQVGAKMPVWPALKDDGKSVAVVFADSGDEAKGLTRDGLLRLYRIALNDQVKHLGKTLPSMRKAELLFAAIGKAPSLREQVFAKAIESVFLQGPWPTSNEAFKHSLELRGELPDAVERIIGLVIQVLTLYQVIRKQLKGQLNLAWANVYQDVGGQLDSLISNEFVAQTPLAVMSDLPRYMKAIEHRLSRFAQQLPKENAWVQELRDWQQRYGQAQKRCLPYSPMATALHDFYWQLQEYRVSLFAQQLGTKHPVSSKRLHKQWQEIESLG
jgi:ATP-dependent helicase HrpA